VEPAWKPVSQQQRPVSHRDPMYPVLLVLQQSAFVAHAKPGVHG
jgi:hypothetical protein